MVIKRTVDKKCIVYCLTDYAHVLMQDSSSCPEAVSLQEQAGKYTISYDLTAEKAHAYACAGNYQMALASYEVLSYLVPYKFSPKYEMSRIYKQTGDTVRLLETYRKISQMPVRILSDEITRIKEDANQALISTP